MEHRLDTILSKKLQALGIHSFWVPGDSRVERSLAARLAAYDPGRKWFRQVPIITQVCRFWVDMATLARPGRAIGIECDGSDFHGDWLRDFCRDAMILDTGRLARVYHIRACDIIHRWPDVLFVLATQEPVLFRSEIREAIFGLERAVCDHWRAPLGKRGCRVRYGERQLPGVQRVIQFAQDRGIVSFPRLVDLVREKLLPNPDILKFRRQS